MKLEVLHYKFIRSKRVPKQSYSFLLCFYLLFLSNIYAQIVNEGPLHIETSTLVYFGDEYTNNGTHNNNGTLYLNSNFINNDSTWAIAGTTIFKSATNNIQTISGSTNYINFYNLEIDNDLTGVQVVDDFGLLVNNAVNLVKGDLRLVGEAQLIQTHPGNNANSSLTGKLQRDQQGNFSAYGYNYWSSPVNTGGTFSISGTIFDGTDVNINPFNPQPILFNTGSPFNGIPSVLDVGGNVTTPLKLNTNWFYKYSYGSSGETLWIKISQNSSLAPGEAFIMKGSNTTDATQNYVFKGIPNDGRYEFMTRPGEYILIGNPYPSALDTNEFIKDNVSASEGGRAEFDVINGTLYFWVEGGSSSHEYTGYLGGYATYNLTSGAPPSIIPMLVGGLGSSEFTTPPKQFMAVAQGFFVQGASNSGILFKNSQRAFKTESSGESVHYKNTSQNNISDKSIVRIGYEDPEGFHRQLVLGFIPNSVADLSYNKAYDAKMFGERADELYFIINNDIKQKYVIQGVGTFDELMEIPLGLKITEEGKHVIMLDATENFQKTVYIKDKLLNITHNLSESNFEINESSGEFSDRFQLVFQPKNTLDINEFERNLVNVYYNGNNNIIIDNPNGVNLYNVMIYNLLGQKLIQLNDNSLDQNKITIPFRKKEGVYLIKIESEIGEGIYKILKN